MPETDSDRKLRERTRSLDFKLTRILRHTAPKNGLSVLPGGWILLQRMLDHAGLMLHYSRDEVKTFVASREDKFEMKYDSSQNLFIRAKPQDITFKLSEPDKTETASTTPSNKSDKDEASIPLPSSEAKLINDEHFFPKLNKKKTLPKDMDRLGKTLKRLLGTGLREKGFTPGTDGYYNLAELLKLPEVESENVLVEDIVELLKKDTCFEMRLTEGRCKKIQLRLRKEGTKERESVVDLVTLKRTLFWALNFAELEKHNIKQTADGFFDVDTLLQMDHGVMCKATRVNIIDLVKHFSEYELRKTPEDGKGTSENNSHLFNANDSLQIRLKKKPVPEVENKPIYKLLRILKHDAPARGLKLYPWGFINIDDILKLDCEEFRGMDIKDMVCLIDNFNRNERNENPLTLRRNPDNPEEIQVRAKKGHTFKVPEGEGFLPMSEQDAKLSKTLSYLLRHAIPESVRDIYGFVPLDWLMKQPNLRRYTRDQVVELVAEPSQPGGLVRCQILTNYESNKPEIRATYGHSFPVSSMELSLIEDAEYPTLFYGASVYDCKDIIKRGLTRTSLTHIHLASNEDHLRRFRFVYYADYNLIDIILCIDMKKAMDDGLQFFRSHNGVILCKGDKLGRLSSKYFIKGLCADVSMPEMDKIVVVLPLPDERHGNRRFGKLPANSDENERTKPAEE